MPEARYHRTRDRFPYRLVTRVIPVGPIRTMRFEAKMLGVGLRRRGVARAYRDRRHLLVNVGCGNTGQPGWVNVDCLDAPGVNCVADCRRGLPLPDGCAQGIFTEHFFEHIDYEDQAPALLGDFLRVLEPGGVLRIVVPDGQKYLEAYAQGGWGPLEAFSPLVGDRGKWTGYEFTTPMEVVNFHFRQYGEHQFSYDEETLSALVRAAGFTAVCRQSFGSSRLPAVAIDSPGRASESLVVEAVKPA